MCEGTFGSVSAFIHSYMRNDLARCWWCVQDEISSPTLRLILALLMAAHYDADVFFKFRVSFLELAPQASDRMVGDIRACLLAVNDNYYPLQRQKDVSFEVCGVGCQPEVYP
jgi:hypothetical protein